MINLHDIPKEIVPETSRIRLQGQNGAIYLGEELIARIDAQTLNFRVRHDFIDATAFGENNHTYLINYTTTFNV